MEAYKTQSFAHAGRMFIMTLYQDCDHGAPWDEEDGHGPVTEWRRDRAKAPGERILCEARGLYRYYDVQEAMRIARRNGWGLTPKEQTAWLLAHGRRPDLGKMRRGEIAAEAVERDFQRLRAWCENEWHYCGVAVQALDDEGDPTGDAFEHALWGIESDSDEYILEVAADLAAEVLAEERRHVYAGATVGV